MHSGSLSWNFVHRAPEEPVTTLLTKINDEYYNMEHGRRGICVIINQEVFDEVLDLDVRYGTDLDAERLKLTFEVSIRFLLEKLRPYFMRTNFPDFRYSPKERERQLARALP